MGLIVDTSVFVFAERQRREADLSQWLDRGPAFLSTITVSELLVGVHRADTVARRNRRTVLVEQIINTFPILPINTNVARVHARLTAALLASGRMIGANDLWIAATAMAHGHAILTANLSEFERVPGLDVLPFPPADSIAP
jgi:tRNA(fMet)-specific endonuclease VapC